MYFRSLQILRGFAALAVVLYHLGFYANAVGGQPNTFFSHFLQHNSHGARFFFVLSGFLMAYLIDTGYRQFLPRRMLRIYPTFLIAAIGVIIIKGFIFRTLFFNLAVFKAMLLLPFGNTPTYPLGVEWTLVYEVFFYLVCSIFANNLLRRSFPFFLLAWLVWLFSAEIYFNSDAWFSADNGASIGLPTAGHIPSSMMNALFIVGGLSYYTFKRIPPLGAKSTLLIVAIGVAVFVFAEQRISRRGFIRESFIPASISLTTIRISLHSISFALIVIGSCAFERGRENKPRTGRVWDFLEHFGDHSYALYLIHVPIITVMLFLVRSHANGRPIGNELCCIALATALVAGWYFGKLDVWLHKTFKRRLFSSVKPRNLPTPGAPTQLIHRG